MHKLVDFYKGYHFVKYYAKTKRMNLLIKGYLFYHLLFHKRYFAFIL